jgi:putative ABC transport system substrate-binding protein
VQAAPRSLGLQMTVVDASAETEIEVAFAALAQENAGALLLNTDPLLLGKREQIVQLAARYKIPTTYFLREFVDAGGPMSYGPNIHNG